MTALSPDLALLAAAVLCLVTWNAVAVAAVARRRLARLEASPTGARKTDETPAAAPCAAAQSGETLSRAIAYRRAMRQGAYIANLYRSR
jgi:hypothetical protein